MTNSHCVLGTRRVMRFYGELGHGGETILDLIKLSGKSSWVVRMRPPQPPPKACHGLGSRSPCIRGGEDDNNRGDGREGVHARRWSGFAMARAVRSWRCCSWIIDLEVDEPLMSLTTHFTGDQPSVVVASELKEDSSIYQRRESGHSLVSAVVRGCIR